MTGRDPGELGIYGFRNRIAHDYRSMAVADSQRGRRGPRMGPPLACRQARDRGRGAADLAAGTRQRRAGVVLPDRRHPQGPLHLSGRPARRGRVARRRLPGGRARASAATIETGSSREVYEMTEQRFTICRHLLDTRPWDFFMMVEIGLDRMHHAFWRFLDAEHPRHEPGHRYRDAIRNYYIYLDEEIGELLERFDEDTTVLVVSDHGARPMQGAICVNEWLAQEGYLVLEETPRGPTPFSDALVDWSRTRAWGEGGYYCRLCVNVAGREPQGIVAPERVRAAARRARGPPRAASGPGRRGDRHADLPAAGAVARAARDPPRPDRLLRRSRLAQQRQPRPRPALDLRQRHGSRRRQPRPQRALHRSRAPGCPRSGARTS